MLLEALVLALGFGSEKLKHATSNYEFEKRQKEIREMDTWDCMEAQVSDHFLNFMKYKIVPEDQKTIAYWGNKKENGAVNISLSDINENRRFSKSGLSMEEYVKQRFLERYKEKGKYIFRNDGLKWITLYDENRNHHKFFVYDETQNGKLEIIYCPDKKEQKRTFYVNLKDIIR